MTVVLSQMQGMERPKEPGLSALRTVRELQEGMVSHRLAGLLFKETLTMILFFPLEKEESTVSCHK